MPQNYPVPPKFGPGDPVLEKKTGNLGHVESMSRPVDHYVYAVAMAYGKIPVEYFREEELIADKK